MATEGGIYETTKSISCKQVKNPLSAKYIEQCRKSDKRIDRAITGYADAGSSAENVFLR